MPSADTRDQAGFLPRSTHSPLQTMERLRRWPSALAPRWSRPPSALARLSRAFASRFRPLGPCLPPADQERGGPEGEPAEGLGQAWSPPSGSPSVPGSPPVPRPIRGALSSSLWRGGGPPRGPPGLGSGVDRRQPTRETGESFGRLRVCILRPVWGWRRGAGLVRFQGVRATSLRSRPRGSGWGHAAGDLGGGPWSGAPGTIPASAMGFMATCRSRPTP